VVSVALSKHQTITETMSDEELVSLARDGCENAFSMLVHRCALTVKYQVISLRNTNVEDEDLAQEGLVGLLAAVRTYDSGMASFRTYASACIRNRMLSVIRGSGASRIIPQSELISIDNNHVATLPIQDFSDDPEQLVVQKEEIVRMQKWLRGLLSPKEYKVLILYLGAYSYEEISQHLGISIKAVDNSLQRVRRKLVTFSFPGS
jgi:RNA polymerase sporulation-specific sigma factor